MPGGKVIKAGWLSKKGGRIQTWHRRWFILKGDVLMYYRGSNDTKPLGTVTLSGNKLLRHGDDGGKQPGCFKFEIVACLDSMSVSQTHDTFLMYADSEKEMDGWIDAIIMVLYERYGGGMFGRHLEDTMALESRLGGRYIPLMVHKCVEFVRKHGMNEVGIFRLPGQATLVSELREKFNQGIQYEFSDDEDIHTVASLLKLYLRELPVPLIEYSLYDSFSKATRMYLHSQEESIKLFSRLVTKLNKWNANMLKYLMKFLHDVQLNSEQNKMTPNNLGTVFGPNILRPTSEDPMIMMECASILTQFVSIVITHQEVIFAGAGDQDERPPHRLRVPEVPEQHLSGVLCTTKHSLVNSSYNRDGGAFGSIVNAIATLPRTSTVGRSVTTPEITQFDSTRKQSLQERTSVGASFDISPNKSSHRKRVSSPTLDMTREKGSPSKASDPGKAMVNSVSAEMLKYEQEIAELKSALSKAKKTSRMWKTRYEAERRERETAELRVTELRHVLDETFQHFVAEEDDEDDDEEEELGNGHEEEEEVAQL